MTLNVPIIDIHRDNFTDFWPAINLAIQTASFIAIDAELSGLGCRRNLMAKSIEDRYRFISEVAKTRSILSIGISCFRLLEDQGNENTTVNPPNQLKFVAQTFNILTLCNEDYMVEPGALQFLVGHGFDFNKQYSSGVLYYRGPDKPEDKSWPSVRLVFNQVLASKKPLALHNGLVDLVFLYQNLYTNLPPTSAQFVADLSEMYAGGIFDTKYVAEYEARMTASYLEFVFRKSQRENALRGQDGSCHTHIDFPQYSDGISAVCYQSYVLPADFLARHREGKPGSKSTLVCEVYAAHGYCNKGMKCPKSHDPDAILDAEEVIAEEKKKRKRRRRNKRNRNREVEVFDGEQDEKKTKEGGEEEQKEEEEMEGSRDVAMETASTSNACIGDKDQMEETGDSNHTVLAVDGSEAGSTQNGMDEGRKKETMKVDPLVPKQSGSHRAGFDAFMTGFATAAFLARFGKKESKPARDQDSSSNAGIGDAATRGSQGQKTVSIMEHFGVGRMINKLYLSGKEYPLAIAKSSFTKTSANHREKMIAIEKLVR
ncbi:target of EGR1 protein 1-like [Diadema antillarum]|uniref:target of EGR1 protein 1-like n=1 Tax=Diadema antillarum TaxID=105358 RepID=UPI003A851D21